MASAAGAASAGVSSATRAKYLALIGEHLGQEKVAVYEPTMVVEPGYLQAAYDAVATDFGSIEAYLRDGLWLKLAEHANRAAARLAEKLEHAGIAPIWPVEASEIFVALSPEGDARLQAAGATYYGWPAERLPAGAMIPPKHRVVRLVASFATTDAEIDSFVGMAAGK